MNPPKRRAKRISNHPGNEDMIVHEDEKPFLNLVARLAVEVFFKDVLDIEEEQITTTKNRPSASRNKNVF
ncbi:MAG: hypothetical protein EOO90_06785 [Pedobacter sp.]|nr:MAG: hypothetical protein EOO90_06785 [Pedobacter sp.]